ncbi:MAG TPA: phenylacetate-CoA oxygenase/reductase subunit PaaK [Chitinophagaceae bacterium]|nr:phenylacetate-CoA oxygenase/reductase subunit PaaK [Chitinophagaceae bacterium]
MATHFHPLTVKAVTKETADCVSICFEIPEPLKDMFQYREGQNITIRKSIDGEELRRSYSICTAPYENELKVAVKKVEGGQFSTYANAAIKAGDVLEVMPPTGKFHSRLHPGKTAQYLAIAAGSGITPVISIIKHTLREEPNSKFTLLYNNRNRGSIIFFEELEALKNNYIDRFNLINILSREKMDAPLLHGRINEEKLSELGRLVSYHSFDEIYICGPEELIRTSSAFLESQGLDKKKIHFELFTTPGQSVQKTKQASQEEADKGPRSQVSIRLDGRTFSFELPYHGKSILDAALGQGADLPFACKGGVCCTCRAKLLAGQVDMDVNYALEEEEVNQGFILTCQSHPRTANVSVDFDTR